MGWSATRAAAGLIRLCWLASTVLLIIVVRYALGLFWFPFYQKNYRGDYQAIAQDILKITQGEALYANDTNAVGLSVSACIDSLTMPKSAIMAPPPHFLLRSFLPALMHCQYSLLVISTVR